MLRDESTNPGRRPVSALNVLGELLENLFGWADDWLLSRRLLQYRQRGCGYATRESETGHLNKTRSIWRPALTKLLKVSENPVGKP
jgi:hypothetical protein